MATLQAFMLLVGKPNGRLAEQGIVIAASLGCFPDELVFTGGGTESDNLAIFGAVSARKERGRHIITTAIEHHAVSAYSCQ